MEIWRHDLILFGDYRFEANGLTFSREPREQTVANWKRHRARIGGCNVLLASPFLAAYPTR
jgi:hypothetical protein